MWWATAIFSFMFFQAGEITVPTALSYDAVVHLSRGDISVSEDHRMLHVFLKPSKIDPYGRGTEVFIGATDNDLCPVNATCLYVAHRGVSAGGFFCSAVGVLLSWCGQS